MIFFSYCCAVKFYKSVAERRLNECKKDSKGILELGFRLLCVNCFRFYFGAVLGALSFAIDTVEEAQSLLQARAI